MGVAWYAGRVNRVRLSTPRHRSKRKFPLYMRLMGVWNLNLTLFSWVSEVPNSFIKVDEGTQNRCTTCAVIYIFYFSKYPDSLENVMATPIQDLSKGTHARTTNGLIILYERISKIDKKMQKITLACKSCKNTTDVSYKKMLCKYYIYNLGRPVVR